MNISIREMEASEAKQVKKIGQQSFELVERLFLPTPKNALVAVIDDEIVGATTYRIFKVKKTQKIGYVETAFVRDGFSGQGVGNKLYSEITTHLKNKGCDTVTAIVRDDNIASWKLFQKNDFNIIKFSQMLKTFGFFGALSLWFKSVLCVAIGHHLWATVPHKKTSELGQLAFYILLNFFTFIPAFFFQSPSLEQFFIGFSSVLALLLVAALGGMLVTLFTKEKWTFHVVRGGILISLIVSALGGVFPIIGRFYPQEYKSSPKFKRNMGIEGLFQWLFVLLLLIIAFILKDQYTIWKSIFSFGPSILLYHAIPIYPFECFGGKRIWDFSKILSIVTILISVVLLIIF